ncbi:alcohol dehydrogenase catalytic domain-containing protein [Actinocatenispora rupis]|uniref:Alcohol dehydrogenase n=1 Tax=Actinocatenispora rupis TaxID=519421 RepID=A0A8J3J654_9ACTN|nr:alcohol dehydrogenase catalytic domain-containing protein [Actinocatenispora rupis]GID15525.1 alcohol dehydrogenase [Actinocatenispora rupis]
MKALVYQGNGGKAWTTAPDPAVEGPRDAVIRVDTATICGTDLHILKGDVPEVKPGRILGHEAVGTVVDAGAATGLAEGDRVLASCISGCGSCDYCRRGRYGQCRNGGGWILGHLIDGVQAEYARIPFADLSTHRLPAEVPDEVAVLFADIMPTSYEVGVHNGRVRPGSVVAVVGAGPIGLAALLCSRLYSPSHLIAIDPAASRRVAADRIADSVVAPEDAEDELRRLGDGLGADVVIEAVGRPEAFELCTRLVRPGGHVANVGVHGAPAALHLESLWISDVTITTGLVDTWSTPELLRMLSGRLIDPADLVTHRFALTDMTEAYDLFADPASSGALKVTLTRT